MEKQYLKVIISNAANRFGDSIDTVLFSWIAYEVTKSGVWSATILGINYLPTVLLQPFTGALIQYLSKKNLLVICDIGRALNVLIIFFFFIFHQLTPLLLIISTLINSILEAFRQPCGIAVIPKLLHPENLESAMALNQSVSRASELIGTSISGILVVLLGIQGALLIDILSFVCSSAILSTLRVLETIEKERMYIKTLSNGFKYFSRHQAITIITIMCCLINLVSVPIEGLRAVFISEGLKLSEDALSIGSVALSLGSFGGTIIYPVFQNLPKRLFFLRCGFMTSILYFFLSLCTYSDSFTVKLLFYGLACVIYGSCTSMVGVALNVVMIKNIDHDFLSRVGGIFNSLVCASMPIAAFLFAMLQRWFSITQIYFTTGVIALIGFSVLSKQKVIRELL